MKVGDYNKIKLLPIAKVNLELTILLRKRAQSPSNKVTWSFLTKKFSESDFSK